MLAFLVKIATINSTRVSIFNINIFYFNIKLVCSIKNDVILVVDYRVNEFLIDIVNIIEINIILACLVKIVAINSTRVSIFCINIFYFNIKFVCLVESVVINSIRVNIFFTSNIFFSDIFIKIVLIKKNI